MAYGAHTLAWSIVDAAGNRTDGSARFDVPDTEPPSFGAPKPPNGASLGSGEVLSVAVAVHDDGSGLDPATVALTLDGAPVDHVWHAEGVVHGVVGARLAAGVHHLVVTAADRAGNAGRLAWDVSVAGGAGSPGGSTPAGGGAPPAARRERHPARPGRPLAPAPPGCAP